MFLAVDDEGFGSACKATGHENFFGDVLDVFDGGNVFAGIDSFKLS